MREITLGASTKDSYVVPEGLAEGEEIVTNGAFSIDAAAQLAGKPSMMNKEAGASSAGHDQDSMSMEPVKQSGTEEKQQAPGIAPTFKDQLTGVYRYYLNMKDAFVASDAQKVSATAKKVSQSLQTVDMNLLTGDVHQLWMEHLSTLLKTSQAISELSDIKNQRTEFVKFNATFYESVKAFGLKDVTAYYQYCPMANNNKGAYWFSNSEEIRNPYFGDEMLRCGENRETLK